jgi:MFS transporter, PPP family, 3-phenylpropionic acid transporter
MPRAESSPGAPAGPDSGGLYPRLSAFYLCYFGTIGVFVPFFSFYLQREGFGAVAIGQLMAIPMAMRVLAPGLWGWAADHSGRRDLTLRVGALLAAAGAALLLGASGFIAVALALAAFALPWTGLLPQFEATTLSHLGERPQRYGLIRLWGSVGFILAVVLGGLVFEGDRVAAVPQVALLLVLATAVAVWRVPPAPAAGDRRAPQRLWSVLRRPWVLVLLLVCILQQAAFSTYYVFFTIYLDQLGYGTGVAGLLWAWGVAAEVVMFIYTPRLIERYGSRVLLVFALGVSSLRWLLTAWAATSLPLLLFAQTLHMAAFRPVSCRRGAADSPRVRRPAAGQGAGVVQCAGFRGRRRPGQPRQRLCLGSPGTHGHLDGAAAVAAVAMAVAWWGLARGAGTGQDSPAGPAHAEGHRHNMRNAE